MSSNFKSVLEERTENMKLEKSRREQFSEAPLHATPPPSAESKPGQGSVLWQDEMNARGGGSEVSIDMGGAGAHFQDQLQVIEDQVSVPI